MRFMEFMRDKFAILLVVWGAISAAMYLALWAFGNGEEWASDASWIPYLGALVVSLFVLVFVLKFYGVRSLEGQVWHLIALGFIMWVLAEFISGIDLLLNVLDMGSLPAILTDNVDYPFLAGYVFMTLGFLHKVRFTEAKPDMGKAFVVLALVGVFTIISTFLVLIPVMDTTMYTGYEKFFLVAYLVMDIVLFGLGLAIALYWGSAVSKGWYVMAAALLSMMIADVGYTAMDLKGIYFDGNLIELAWVGCYLLIGLAGHYQRKLHESFM